MKDTKTKKQEVDQEEQQEPKMLPEQEVRRILCEVRAAVESMQQRPMILVSLPPAAAIEAADEDELGQPAEEDFEEDDVRA